MSKLDEAIEKFNEPTPAPEYKPMLDAFEPPRKKEEPEISKDDLARAAADRNKESGVSEQRPFVERSYSYVGGEDDGKPVPPNETLSIDRAARDLSRQRNFEDQALFQQADETVAAVTDATRAEALQQQQPTQPEQQPPPQPEQQPQQPQVDVQQQQAQQPASDEEALRSALERPAVRQALEQQIAQVEQARANYAAQADAAFAVSYSSLMSGFPELNGISVQQLPAVLQAIQKVDPIRHAAIVNHLHSTDRLHRTATEAKAAEAQISQARQKMWSDAEDKRFAEQVLSKEPISTVESVLRNGARILQGYGISPGDLQNIPAVRSFAGQQVLYDLIKSKLAAENLAAKRVPPAVPPVMRPGASQPQGTSDDRDVASALAKFNKNPNPKTAADVVNARRAARR